MICMTEEQFKRDFTAEQTGQTTVQIRNKASGFTKACVLRNGTFNAYGLRLKIADFKPMKSRRAG